MLKELGKAKLEQCLEGLLFHADFEAERDEGKIDKHLEVAGTTEDIFEDMVEIIKKYNLKEEEYKDIFKKFCEYTFNYQIDRTSTFTQSLTLKKKNNYIDTAEKIIKRFNL